MSIEFQAGKALKRSSPPRPLITKVEESYVSKRGGDLHCVMYLWAWIELGLGPESMTVSWCCQGPWKVVRPRALELSVLTNAIGGSFCLPLALRLWLSYSQSSWLQQPLLYMAATLYSGLRNRESNLLQLQLKARVALHFKSEPLPWAKFCICFSACTQQRTFGGA